MRKRINTFVRVFTSTTVIVFSIIMIFIHQLDLEMNQKIGKGIFYIKGYYEQGNEIVMEQGIGVITIPLIIGFIVSMVAAVISAIGNKQKYGD
jgi:ABC-type phosphate transport system permease subunit